MKWSQSHGRRSFKLLNDEIEPLSQREHDEFLERITPLSEKYRNKVVNILEATYYVENRKPSGELYLYMVRLSVGPDGFLAHDPRPDMEELAAQIRSAEKNEDNEELSIEEQEKHKANLEWLREKRANYFPEISDALEKRIKDILFGT